MPSPMLPPKRRNPVAKAMRRLHGGAHRTGPNRADLKRELRRHLAASKPPPQAGMD